VAAAARETVSRRRWPVVSVGRVSIRVALVGDRQEHYPSHREAAAVIPMLGADVHAEWVATDGEQIGHLDDFHAVWLLPGSPYADDTAALAAITFARTRGVPFLGTCGGLQYAVVEYFRNVLGDAAASHAESDGIGDGNVVSALSCSLMGVEREVRPVAGTRFARLMGAPFTGMHYCNYGPTASAIARLVDGGFVVGATADDAEAEVLDLADHPFFVLTLFQPQIGALAGRPLHPLLAEFIRRAGAFAAAS
jgi:CTP synthase (UTP-ammonia lyase)